MAAKLSPPASGVSRCSPPKVARIAEIAQALFVTLRTVETHLTHAYGKLDVTSQDQLLAVLG